MKRGGCDGQEIPCLRASTGEEQDELKRIGIGAGCWRPCQSNASEVLLSMRRRLKMEGIRIPMFPAGAGAAPVDSGVEAPLSQGALRSTSASIPRRLDMANRYGGRLHRHASPRIGSSVEEKPGRCAGFRSGRPPSNQGNPASAGPHDLLRHNAGRSPPRRWFGEREPKPEALRRPQPHEATGRGAVLLCPYRWRRVEVTDRRTRDWAG